MDCKVSNILFDNKSDETSRRASLYDGDVFVFSPTPGSTLLCELARSMAEEAFAPLDPPTAQHELPVERYVEILKKLKPKFIHHPKCKELIPQILQECGSNLKETYFDVPRLRTACAGDYLNTGLAYAFKPHRDTWYSPPMCQLNWWMPVYENDADNGMAFHPAYWNKAVKNSSSRFNYQDWNVRGRVQASQQSTKRDSRFQSAALEELQLQPDIRIVCPPGGIILFSAAHLHSTVPNTTEVTRFSIDFRTVDARDIAVNRGAPNVDSESRGTTMMDYLRGTDLQHFSDETIQRYAELIPEAESPTPDAMIDAALAVGADE